MFIFFSVFKIPKNIEGLVWKPSNILAINTMKNVNIRGGEIFSRRRKIKGRKKNPKNLIYPWSLRGATASLAKKNKNGKKPLLWRVLNSRLIFQNHGSCPLFPPISLIATPFLYLHIRPHHPPSSQCFSKPESPYALLPPLKEFIPLSPKTYSSSAATPH